MAKNKKSESGNRYLYIGLVILAMALVWGPLKKRYFDAHPSVTTPVPTQVQDEIDPLCQEIKGVQLKCLVSPAGEGVMGPGHYVDYPSDSPANAKVPFSRGNLFDQSCVASGIQAGQLIAELMTQLQAQEKTNAIVLDEVTYKVDKAFGSGAELPIPKFPELTIKGGPNLSELQEISLKAPKAWLKVIDENRFIDLLTKAAIRDTCIDQLIRQEYRVISMSAFMQDYEIAAKEKSGQSFELSAAITKGELQIEGGGNAGSTLEENIRNRSSVPVVVGVDFFDPKVIQDNRAKLVAPVFSAAGQTSVRAQARGQGGQLWQVERHAPFGQSLPVEQRGGGESSSSQCGPGTQSVIQLTTLIAPAAQQSLGGATYDFTAIGGITGGISRTLSCAPIPQTVEAEVSFDSTIKSIVRSDAATIMRVALNDIPSGDAQVSDWLGRELPKRIPEGPPADGQTGNIMNFGLAGAGVYNVHVSGRLTVASFSDVKINQHGSVNIIVQ